MANVKSATEQELREMDVPWPKSLDELNQYIIDLSERKHDYGTCVYAMSMSALATFYYVSHVLGVTGFQAGCADMDFIKRCRRMKDGFRLIDYNKLLYPQMVNSENFPTPEEILIENLPHLQKKAKQLLKDSPDAHPNVLARWKYIADLRQPEDTND